MAYQEILGSDAYVKRLAEAALSIRDGAGAGDDFIVVQPGGTITQSLYLR
jgi:hypothetical protein